MRSKYQVYKVEPWGFWVVRNTGGWYSEHASWWGAMYQVNRLLDQDYSNLILASKRWRDG